MIVTSPQPGQTDEFGTTHFVMLARVFWRFAHLPDYFWKEIVEDLYKEWDGPTSAKIRLERRDQGKDPSTGEPVTPVTKK